VHWRKAGWSFHGVIAIIITIMVLELKAPHGADLESADFKAPTSQRNPPIAG
jgi:hypothetical protein